MSDQSPEALAKKAERKAARKAQRKERQAQVAELSAQAATAEAAGNPEEALAAYRSLAEAMKRAPGNRATLSPEEKKAKRTARREARKRGEYVRQGKPWSEEQRAKQAAQWTPEKRAEASQRSKGRVASPEQVEKLKAAAQARRDKQEAMQKRLAELEAIVAGGAAPQNDEAQAPKRSKRN